MLIGNISYFYPDIFLPALREKLSNGNIKHRCHSIKWVKNFKLRAKGITCKTDCIVFIRMNLM